LDWGRYSDKLDAEGIKKACKELSCILDPDRNLYFSVTVGKEKVYFNAHRIHYPHLIIKYFKDLKLVEVSGVTDSRRFVENLGLNILEKSNYVCGLFWFKKNKKRLKLSC
jgi:hypothetical protein